MLSSYVISARLSGALRQLLSCSAATSDVHDNASPAGSITELGFDLECRDGTIAASLSGSVTARHETTKVRVGNKVQTRTTTVWEGGFSLREPKTHLALTFDVSAAGVNHDLIVSAASSAVVVVMHTERTYHLRLRITPQYSTT